MPEGRDPAGTSDQSGGGRIDAAVAQYWERIDAGQHVDPEQFLREYPDIQEELREFLDNKQAVDRFIESVSSLCDTTANEPDPGTDRSRSTRRCSGRGSRTSGTLHDRAPVGTRGVRHSLSGS